MARNDTRELQIESLERLTEEELCEQILGLNDEQLSAVSDMVDRALSRERQGFDRFFESISQTLKYIPNFIVLAITNKYIDPPIAARITSKLPIKNAVQIAKGLSVEYICECAIYLDERYAASLLGQLPRKQAGKVVDRLVIQHPLRVLDILEYGDDDLHSLGDFQLEVFDATESGLNDLRRRTLSRISAYR